MLDTNILLDLFVFADEGCTALRAALQARQVRWIATPAMRQELARVLDYGQIAVRLRSQGLQGDGVLAQFDAHAQPVAAAARAASTCSDPDDQKFIDLAIEHGCLLLSKDRAVLAMRKRLQRTGADVARTWTPEVATA